MTDDAEWTRAFESDFGAALADLDDADRAMLAYVEKLTRAPASITARDIDQLRQHGFDDRMIHDIAAVAGYFAFVNRLADGLGVELESYWEEEAGS